MASDTSDLVRHLTSELANFEDIARYLSPQPGELPKVKGVDVFGGTLPLNGIVGGDHLIYVDFKQRFDLEARIRQALSENKLEVVENLRRCQKMAGIAVLDVAGHQATDAFMAAMLHQAFLLGSIYELDLFGHITRRLLENLNTRFYQSSASYKFVSMIYGEISEDFRFRFISAAQPFPAVFSREHDRFMEVGKELRIVFPPLGMQPSLDVIDRDLSTSPLGFKHHYELNDWLLMGQGDILLLHTDGLSEHVRGREPYFPGRLEQAVRRVKDLPAADIYAAIKADLIAFSPPQDDVTIVVIKRT